MSTPAVGFHAHVREKSISKYTGVYGHISPDDLFTVVRIDEGYGRRCIHLQRDGGGIVPVWLGDVKALPRCKYCNSEEHTKKSATKTNCAELSRQESGKK